MLKMRIHLFTTALVLLMGWAISGNTLVGGHAGQSAPAYGDVAVLRQQCTEKDWQYRLHIDTESLPVNLAARDVLIKSSQQGGRLREQPYRADEIFVRDCGAQERTCWQAKAASLHFRLGSDGMPRAGTLMLVSAKRQLLVHRFAVRMEEPEDTCQSDVRS